MNSQPVIYTETNFFQKLQDRQLTGKKMAPVQDLGILAARELYLQRDGLLTEFRKVETAKEKWNQSERKWRRYSFEVRDKNARTYNRQATLLRRALAKKGWFLATPESCRAGGCSLCVYSERAPRFTINEFPFTRLTGKKPSEF